MGSLFYLAITFRTRVADVRRFRYPFSTSLSRCRECACSLVVDAQVLDSSGAHVADVFRGDVVNSHGDQFVRIGMCVAQRVRACR